MDQFKSFNDFNTRHYYSTMSYFGTMDHYYRVQEFNAMNQDNNEVVVEPVDTGRAVEVAVVDDWKPLIDPNAADQWAIQFETLYPVTSETTVPTSNRVGASTSEEEAQSRHRFFDDYKKAHVRVTWWRTRSCLLGAVIQPEMPKPSHIPEENRIHHGPIPRHVLPTQPLGRWEDSQCERGLGFRWDLDRRNNKGLLLHGVKENIRRNLSSPRSDDRYNTVYTLTEQTLGELHTIFSEPKASQVRQMFELRGISHDEQVECAETLGTYMTPEQ
jgi:hypothetical protein